MKFSLVYPYKIPQLTALGWEDYKQCETASMQTHCQPSPSTAQGPELMHCWQHPASASLPTSGATQDKNLAASTTKKKHFWSLNLMLQTTAHLFVLNSCIRSEEQVTDDENTTTAIAGCVIYSIPPSLHPTILPRPPKRSYPSLQGRQRIYFRQNLTFWKIIITASYLSEKPGHLCPLPFLHRRPNGLLTPQEGTAAGSGPPLITTGHGRVRLASAMARITCKEDGQSSEDSGTAMQWVARLVTEHVALATAACACAYRVGKLAE